MFILRKKKRKKKTIKKDLIKGEWKLNRIQKCYTCLYHHDKSAPICQNCRDFYNWVQDTTWEDIKQKLKR